MNKTVGILLTSAALIAPTVFSSQLQAADQLLVDPEKECQVDIFGEFEWGVRYIDKPDRDGEAKFEEYRDLESGLFLEDLHAGYVGPCAAWLLEVWAENAGQDDQYFRAELVKPGHHYLALDWNEIRVLSSTSAQTIFDTSNPSALTVPDAVQQALEAVGNNPAAIAPIIADNLQPIELSTQRNRGKVSTRYTPTPEWDFRIEYMNETRDGIMAPSFGSSNDGFNFIELPAPVDYTTQIIDVSGQYVGAIDSDQNWSASVAYMGSFFENDVTSFTWDNPFFFVNTAANPALNQNSLPPENQAHQVTFTGAIDLTADTRNVTTASYQRMTQNDPFLPKTINPAIVAAPLPAASLNGEVETTMIDNLFTTRITPDVRGKLHYRYFDFDNNTPELFFTDRVRADGALVTEDRVNLALAYTKQNADAEIVGNVTDGVSLGAAYGWERWDRDRREANTTDEHSGRLFFDATHEDGTVWRGSVLAASRRYDEYDYLGNVAAFTYPNGGETQNLIMRKFDMADRDRIKTRLSGEFDLGHDIYVIPTVMWRYDDYDDTVEDGTEALGLDFDTSWSAGVEADFPVGDHTIVVLDYTFEQFDRALNNRQRGGGCPTVPAGVGSPTCDWRTNMTDDVHTLTANVNHTIIPGVLELNLDFIQSWARNSQTTVFGPGITPSPVTGGQFPDVTNSYTRAGVELDYALDPAHFGAEDPDEEVGMHVKLRYAFESNHGTNWQTDPVAAYLGLFDSGAGRSLFLDSINPDYDAHIAELVFAATW